MIVSGTVPSLQLLQTGLCQQSARKMANPVPRHVLLSLLLDEGPFSEMALLGVTRTEQQCCTKVIAKQHWPIKERSGIALLVEWVWLLRHRQNVGKHRSSVVQDSTALL